MGIDHQPASGANEDDGTLALSHQFSLFIDSNPMRAQKLVLELSISEFCADLERLGKVSLGDLVRTISTQPPHKTVADIHAFFYPCFDEGEEELRQRVGVVVNAIEATVPEHVALDRESAILAKDALCGISLCQSALCLGAYELSGAIRDAGSGIDSSLIKPFTKGIDDTCQIMTRISKTKSLLPDLKKKAINALVRPINEESKKRKQAINARIEDLKNHYDPLTAHAVERLHDIVPPALKDYLQQPFKEALTEYTRAEFKKIFKSEVNKVREQKIYDIDAQLESFDAKLKTLRY